MGNLMARMARRADQRRRDFASETVSYSGDRQPVRGEGGAALTCELLATVGRTAFERSAENGLLVADEHRDYLITAADLELGGQVVAPLAGDRIRQEIGGVIEVYEVMAPAGVDVFEKRDPAGLMLRIHTKRVGREAVQ